MANFDVSNPEYSNVLRELETKDRGHADVFNALFRALINNDEFLKKVLEELKIGKQDAEEGKGLSEENYTSAEKEKLKNLSTITAGHGISVTQAEDGSKIVAQTGARVYIGEDAPDPDEYDLHVW